MLLYQPFFKNVFVFNEFSFICDMSSENDSVKYMIYIIRGGVAIHDKNFKRFIVATKHSMCDLCQSCQARMQRVKDPGQ